MTMTMPGGSMRPAAAVVASATCCKLSISTARPRHSIDSMHRSDANRNGVCIGVLFYLCSLGVVDGRSTSSYTTPRSSLSLHL
jgi:hypothetical protein